MEETSISIIELSNMAGIICKAQSKQEGLDPQSALLFGIASGLDVSITLLEQSTGVCFNGLPADKAMKISQYFREEADRSEKIHRQVAIWYRAWTEVLERIYLK